MLGGVFRICSCSAGYYLVPGQCCFMQICSVFLQSASIGGCAHLVNFRGTDTIASLTMARYVCVCVCQCPQKADTSGGVLYYTIHGHTFKTSYIQTLFTTWHPVRVDQSHGEWTDGSRSAVK